MAVRLEDANVGMLSGHAIMALTFLAEKCYTY